MFYTSTIIKKEPNGINVEIKTSSDDESNTEINLVPYKESIITLTECKASAHSRFGRLTFFLDSTIKL